MKTFVLTLAIASSALVTEARIAHPVRRDAAPNKDTVKAKVFALIDRVLNPKSLKPRQDQCVQDDYYDILSTYSKIDAFCSDFLDIQPIVNYVEYTPTVTVSEVYTTRTLPNGVVTRVTPYSTVTVSTTTTAGALNRRNAAHPLVERDAEAAEMLLRVRQVSSGNDGIDVDSAVSSYCLNCRFGLARTTTQTYTNLAVYVTRSVQAIERPDVTSTIVVPTQVTTQTIVETVRLAGTTTTASPIVEATPTSIPITCPASDNTTQTQLINGRNYIYSVACGIDFLDNNVAERTYATFTDCISACSIANEANNAAACQGVSFSGPSDDGSANCFFKQSTNLEIIAEGGSVAILESVGVYESGAAARVAFASSTATDAVDAALTGTATTVSYITPAPFVVANREAVTLDGSTFYTATESSTYVSGNGSWTSAYYTSYSSAWGASGGSTYASTTTIVGSGSESGSSSGSGSGGSAGGSATNVTIGSGEGYTVRNETVVTRDGNTTTTTETITYVYNNGTTETYRTVTSYSREGSSSGGSAGGSSGSGGSSSGGSSGSGGSSSGGSSGGSAGTTTTNSTRTIIIIIVDESSSSSGGGSGGGSGGSVTTVYETTVTSVYPGGATSGSGGGGGGGFSTITSGAISSSSTFVPANTTSAPSSTFSGSSTSGARTGTESDFDSTVTVTQSSTVTTRASFTPPSEFPSITSSGSAPFPNTTAPETTATPTSTGPFNGTTTSGARTGTEDESTTSFTPTGTNPSGPITPSSTASSESAPFPFPSNSTTAGPSETSPTGTVPSGTGITSFPGNSSSFIPTATPSSIFNLSSTSGARTGTDFDSTSVPLTTGPSSVPTNSFNSTIPFPTAPTSTPSLTGCPTVSVGTVTVTETTTVSACFSSCVPTRQWGGYHTKGPKPYWGAYDEDDQ